MISLSTAASHTGRVGDAVLSDYSALCCIGSCGVLPSTAPRGRFWWFIESARVFAGLALLPGRASGREFSRLVFRSTSPLLRAQTLILSATRTPSGSLLGSLSSLKTTELGSLAISSALQRAKVKGDQVDEVRGWQSPHHSQPMYIVKSLAAHRSLWAACCRPVSGRLRRARRPCAAVRCDVCVRHTCTSDAPH